MEVREFYEESPGVYVAIVNVNGASCKVRLPSAKATESDILFAMATNREIIQARDGLIRGNDIKNDILTILQQLKDLNQKIQDAQVPQVVKDYVAKITELVIVLIRLLELLR